ncbi:MBL fold metallo-hydrolase [archaeon]|nr:MBL fold metallo-hydrolase [archaeon]
MNNLICLLAFAPFFAIIVPAFADSVSIIEVESNPSGTDAGNEWIKLFNFGSDSIDLSGWAVLTNDGEIHTISNLTLSACTETMISFSSQFLDNQQEMLILIDTNQNLVDQTSTITDTSNDGTTWNVPVPICESIVPVEIQSDAPIAFSDAFLTLVFVDLGTKGESIIVIYPNGKTMLVDGGMSGAYDKLESTLKQYGISEIDVMIATHADQDHIAGLTKVLDDSDFTVRQVLMSHVPSTSNAYDSFLDAISDGSLQPNVVYDGHKITLDETVSSNIISPPPDGISDAANATPSNSNSLITLLEYGDISFLLTADATFTTEEYLVQNHHVDVDIMNSPHHGSKFSSTDEFLDVVTPKLVIFSANQNNVHNHPASEIISVYDTNGINHYQTGLHGNIVIKTDGVRCSLFVDGEVEQPCYSNVQIVPEFPFGIVVLLSAMSGVVASIKFGSRFSFFR